MAKRKSKKVSAYTRNRNRILSNIRRLNKKGIIVDLYIPTEKVLKSQGVKGSELTKLTRELKAFKSKEIASMGRKVTFPSEDEQAISDSILQQGFAQVEVQGFKQSVSNFPKEIADKVIALIDTLIREQGLEDVAYVLENVPCQLHDYLNRNKYDSSAALQEYSTALIEYLPKASDAYKQDLMDAFEYEELGYTIED